MIPTGKYLVCLDSGSYCLYFEKSKDTPEGITLFTYVCQHMTGISGNKKISGYGRIEWNFISIKGRQNTVEGNG